MVNRAFSLILFGKLFTLSKLKVHVEITEVITVNLAIRDAQVFLIADLVEQSLDFLRIVYDFLAIFASELFNCDVI